MRFINVMASLVGKNTIWCTIDYISGPRPLPPRKTDFRTGFYPDVDDPIPIVSADTESRATKARLDFRPVYLVAVAPSIDMVCAFLK